MSNAETSKLYETIIEDVINDSRQDFEDSGIDELTLQELRRIWCEKLSQSRVARFSWDQDASDDPRAHPLLDASAMTTAPYHYSPDQLRDGSVSNTLGPPASSGSFPDPAGIEVPNMLPPNNAATFQTVHKPNQNNLDIEFPSIQNAGDSSTASGLILPNISQSDGLVEFTLYTNNPAQTLRHLKQSERKRKPKTLSQADGTMGGGDDDDEDDDDIFNDSDDINSDLDDGLDSDKSETEEGDQEGQIMLCLYDKVQRIKNKWKSGLKEGIANINGKDYVFQKATGECEW